MTFTFDLTDPRLLTLLQHCKKHWRHHSVPYSGGKEALSEPSIVLVKDDGVYLMAPFPLEGAPAEARLETDDPTKKRKFVVYSSDPTHNPDSEEYEWLGGDDFADVLPWVDDLLAGIKAGKKEASIRLTAKSMTLELR